MPEKPDLAAKLDAIDRDLAARLIAATHRPELANLPGNVPLVKKRGPAPTAISLPRGGSDNG